MSTVQTPSPEHGPSVQKLDAIVIGAGFGGSVWALVEVALSRRSRPLATPVEKTASAFAGFAVMGLFTAERGAGTQLDGRRLRVSQRAGLEGALIGTGFPYRENKGWLKPYLAMLERVMNATAGVRRPGAASLDLAYVAAGRLDGFWEVGLSPWDTAAGNLLITEAGGRVGDFTGGEYRDGGNLLVGTPRVFAALVETFAPLLDESLRK